MGKRLRQTLPYKFYSFKYNIADYNKVLKWINSKQFDLVIHLAAIVPTNRVNKNFKVAKKINVDGTKNIIKALSTLREPPKWFFFASTSHVYPSTNFYKKISEYCRTNPYSKYGKTKKEAEKIIKKILIIKKLNFALEGYSVLRIKDKNLRTLFQAYLLKLKKENQFY